jgi:hypothetical protein
MKTKYMSVALTAGVALGLAFCPAARANAVAPQADESAQPRIADATMKLEKAFNEQFVQGSIDRGALSAPIDDVLQAMPESARPHLQAHIEQVIQTAAGLASQMTPEKRAQVTASPPPEKLGATQQAQIAGFGWPNAGGWGGYGAFGFPGFATGYSTGIGISCGYNSQSVNGWGYSVGGCTPPVGYGFGY